MCRKAIKGLENIQLWTFPNWKSIAFGDQNCEEKLKKYESYDLWEMHEGIHLYSLSAIHAAYIAMIQIEKELNKNANTEELEEIANNIKSYCLENLCNKELKILKRNNKDNITDISILGTVIPFAMLEANQKEITNTIEKINLNLRTYTGGYIRFENDSYMGGNNPWPIATLWMALYNIKTKNTQEAIKQIEFITKTATKHGFLSEQIDNETMKAKWVIGLGWSHAMYIIALEQLLHN